MLSEYQLGSLKYTCISLHAVGAWGVAMVPHPILLLHVLYMRHIRLISIYIGNLNYKIKIPFFRCRGEIFTWILYRIRYFFYKIQCNVIFYAKRELYLLLKIHRHLDCVDVSIVMFCCLYFT